MVQNTKVQSWQDELDNLHTEMKQIRGCSDAEEALYNKLDKRFWSVAKWLRTERRNNNMDKGDEVRAWTEEREETIDAQGAMLDIQRDEERHFTDSEERRYKQLESRFWELDHKIRTEEDITEKERRILEHRANGGAGRPACEDTQRGLMADGGGGLMDETPTRETEKKRPGGWQKVDIMKSKTTRDIFPEAKRDEGNYETLGAFVKAVATDEVRSADKSQGGAFIPVEYSEPYLETALSESIVEPLATVYEMKGEQRKIPAFEITDRDTSVHGFISYWTGEESAITESDAKTRSITLNAHKQGIYTEQPNEVLSDAQSYEQSFGNVMLSAAGWEREKHYFRGNGAGQPLGILNADATVSVTSTGAGISYTDAAAMFSRLLPGSFNRAVWSVAPSEIPYLLALVPSTEGAVYGVMAKDDSGNMSLFGRPIHVTEHLNTSTESGSVALVDWSFYGVGLRQDMELAKSEHFKFSSDITAFKLTQRFDGQPLLDKAVGLANSTVSNSAYIQLAR